MTSSETILLQQLYSNPITNKITPADEVSDSAKVEEKPHADDTLEEL